MAKKSGQARVPTLEAQRRLFDAIQEHRHPEKNTAIMRISFCLGLRVQEISLLQLKEVCKLAPFKVDQSRDFKLYEVMSLPAAYTKGANALKRSRSEYKRTKISFTVTEFERVVQQIEKLAKAGADINATDFHPDLVSHKGKSRDLPMVDESLRQALIDYIEVRLAKDPSALPSDPLFITQKGGSYSPNTLQEHMALMLRDWAGIEKATSHSGRRTLLTDIIQNQNEGLKVAQLVAGHVSPATTVIYSQPTEKAVSRALKNRSKE
ncbi:site-specific integrase [Echinimonas agarilytica]|uniref:Site-specific integrase n=1 Tax=Echinimonas agarilytica TaxID=1215918 RepID=A0AA41WAH2_9GAMM|nr:site-specific integrase [Echinimonas agarilytica]MCM2681178.1 site-specific integrase [Echinimonas agarilytica]